MSEVYMLKWYIVKYKAGGVIDEILVMGHDEKEAKNNARIQVQCAMNRGGKFIVYNVRDEGQPDPFTLELDKYKKR
jgi:hypothetical protein